MDKEASNKSCDLDIFASIGTKQFAELFGCTRHKIDKLRSEEPECLPPAFKFKGQVRYRLVDIKTWLQDLLKAEQLKTGSNLPRPEIEAISRVRKHPLLSGSKNKHPDSAQTDPAPMGSVGNGDEAQPSLQSTQSVGAGEPQRGGVISISSEIPNSARLPSTGDVMTADSSADPAMESQSADATPAK